MIYLVIQLYGHKRWYRNNNQRHRLNGPAAVYIDGSMEYWVNGKEVTEYEIMFISGSSND